MATEIEVTFAKSQTLPEPVPEGRLQLVDESAGATEVEAYVGTQNGTKKITDKDKASIEALKDGTLVPKLAENMTPYAEDSGTTQTQPFFLEGTATGNGESRVDAKQVPAFAFLQEKRGNMVTVNQLLNSADFPATTTVNGIAFTNNGDGTITVNGTATADAYIVVKNSNNAIPAGHSVLVRGCPAGGGNTTYHMYPITTTGVAMSGSKDTGNGVIAVSQTRDINGVFIFITNGTTVSNLVFRPKLVDLTQWFNGNIPAYLLSHPETFGRYYKGSLAYEPGRLEPATGRYLTSVGRNIWDEEWESGTIASDGTTADSTNRIRSKNFISVIPNGSYYIYSGAVNFRACFYDRNKNYLGDGFPNSSHLITPQQNCSYIKFVVGNSSSPVTTYNHDITISLYYSGESGYDQHYPYEVLAVVDTGSEDLGAFDVKHPNGLIERNGETIVFDGVTTGAKVNSVSYLSDKNLYYAVVTLTSAKAGVRGADYIVCDKFIAKYANEIGNIYFSNNEGTYLIIINADQTLTTADAWNTWLTTHNITVEYLLAEANRTTEQGTPFQENIPIDDFGQLSWSNTDVPQGNQIFYPVDYKAYEDTLIKYTDGDATSLALKSAITDAALNARGYYKMQDLSSAVGDVAGLTYAWKKATQIGNLFTVSIRATNNTGSAISANATLFNLPSAFILDSTLYMVGYAGLSISGDTKVVVNAGRVYVEKAIANGEAITFTLIYTK